MKKYLKKIILLLITFVFLYLVFVNVNLSELLNQLKSFKLKYIPLLLCSITISLCFRSVCFRLLISKTVKNLKLKELVPLCLSAASLNILLPARAGDIFRAYYIGEKYDADKVKILGTVLFERIFDVIVIFLFLCAGIFLYHNNSLAVKLCIGAAILLFFSIVFAILSYKHNNLIPDKCRFVKKLCCSFFQGFEVIDSPKTIMLALFSSVGIWAFECLNFYIMILGFGYHLHWSITIFIISFIALACMIPSTSIFIGPYQLAVISAFNLYNVNKETALAISLTEQAIVAVFTSLVAVIFLLKNNISYKKLKKDLA